MVQVVLPAEYYLTVVLPRSQNKVIPQETRINFLKVASNIQAVENHPSFLNVRAFIVSHAILKKGQGPNQPSKAESMTRIWWLIVFGAACYGFGALSVTADELFGIAQFYGPSGLYYFPVIGPRGLWDSWVYVFTGLAVCLFLSLLSILKLQRQEPAYHP